MDGPKEQFWAQAITWAPNIDIASMIVLVSLLLRRHRAYRGGVHRGALIPNSR